MKVQRYLSYRLLLSLLGCLSVWTVARVPVVLAQAALSEYQSLVEQGLREYDLGNFSEAKAFFQQAHQLSPNARTLRGLGMASYELRHYVEAVAYFDKALASSERPLTAQMHAEVSQLLTQARSFVTRLKLTVTPADAQLRLDTRELFRDSDGSVLLDPGTHELVAESPAYEPITRSVRCDVGETLSLALTLRNASSAPEAAPSAEPASLTAALDAEPSNVAPFIVIAASAAVTVAGGVLLAVALSNKHAVENIDQTESGPLYADYKRRAESVLPLSAAGITGLALGLAGVTVGVAWKLSNYEREPRARLAISPGGLLLSGQF